MIKNIKLKKIEISKIIIFFIISFSFSCASVNSVIDKNYGWKNLKRIAVLPFSQNSKNMEGIDSIFAKYLIKNGFSVVEREKIESILAEQKMTLSGFIKGKEKIDPGVLGVDAIMIVQILYLNPNKKEEGYFLKTNRIEEPNFQKTTVKTSDGKTIQKIEEKGVKVKYDNKWEKKVIGEYSEVSITLRLIDVKTGEIIWVASDNETDKTILNAVEKTADSLISSFYKDFKKTLKD